MMVRTRALAVAAALICAGAGWAAAEQAQPRPRLDEAPLRPMMEQAVAAVKAGKASEALFTLGEIDSKFEAAYAGGPRVYCSRSPTETLLYLTKSTAQSGNAIAIGPLWCDAIYLKAYSLIELKRPVEAASDLDRVLRMAPHNAQYLSERADLYIRMRNLDAALAMFRQAGEDAAIAPRPDTVKQFQSRACRGVGYVLIEKGKLDEAESNYKSCLAIDPNDQKAKAELVYIARKRAKPQ